MFVLLSSQISDQAAGIITWYRAHQHWSAGLHLQTQERNVSTDSTILTMANVSSEKTTEEILVTTSLSTILARSRGCSMRLMKDSPSTFETKMCDIARRRSGRKASISNSWCTAWPMGAEHGVVQGRADRSEQGHVYKEYILYIFTFIKKKKKSINICLALTFTHHLSIYSLDCFSSDHR